MPFDDLNGVMAVLNIIFSVTSVSVIKCTPKNLKPFLLSYFFPCLANLRHWPTNSKLPLRCELTDLKMIPPPRCGSWKDSTRQGFCRCWKTRG